MDVKIMFKVMYHLKEKEFEFSNVFKISNVTAFTYLIIT